MENPSLPSYDKWIHFVSIQLPLVKAETELIHHPCLNMLISMHASTLIYASN